MELFKYLSSIVSQTLSRFANAAIKASKDDRLSVCKTVSLDKEKTGKGKLTVHLDPRMGCTVGLEISVVEGTWHWVLA